MKILTIVGARPQFIKASAVSRAINGFDTIVEVIVHTGQHYDVNMSDIFFEEMKIPKPDYFLGIGGKSHGSMTGQMIEKIEEVLLNEKPDFVLIYGDTNSTLAGAIAASKLQIKIAHIEAGLRSFNMKMPEEINRILSDRLSDLLFCPTETAVSNLREEGFPFITSNKREQRIMNVGDVMQDCALFYKRLAKKPNINNHNFNISKSDEYILCTVHRAENTDDKEKLRNIFEALKEISKDKKIILPLHPRTKNKLSEFGLLDITDTVFIIEPVGYLEMVWLIDNCSLIMTDSGGLQKEAYFFGKPCITIRDETEWVELIDNNFNVLAGADKEKILHLFNDFSFNKDFTLNLYGKGNASELIVKVLIDY